MNNRNQMSGDVIDLAELFFKILSKWYFCLMGLVAGAVCGFLYVSLLITPLYQSTAEVYLRGNNATLSLESLSLSSRLATDYEIIFKSRPNLEKTIDDLDLKISATALSNMVTISNIEDTRILQISVQADSPELAKNIANSVMENGMDSVREIDSQEPYVIEKAVELSSPVNASKRKYTMMGGLAGMALVVGIITLLFVMNDNIKSADEIEKYLDIPVLAVILEDEGLKVSSRKGKTKKRRK